MTQTVEEGGGRQALEAGRLHGGSPVEGVHRAVFLQREAEAELVGKVGRERVVGRRGEDAVVPDRVRIRQRQVFRPQLRNVLPRVARKEVQFLTKGLVDPRVELVGVDVLPARAQVIEAVIRNGLPKRCIRLHIGVRVELQKRRGAGRDAGDGGARVVAAGERVAERGRLLGEVAALHARGRHLGLEHGGQRETKALVGAEEEGPVVAVVQMRNDDRAADRDAEVVGNLLRLDWIGHVALIGRGIERAVLVVFKERAVQGVRTGLRHGGNLAGLAILGIVVDAVHADLGDGFGRGKGIGLHVVVGLVLRADAVDGRLGLRGQTALDGELHSRTG